jgi:hypothetical protein
MAIEVTFSPRAMTSEQYDDVIRRLEAAGCGSPPARLYHVCFGAGSNLAMIDVWDSAEELEAFARTLMPILQGCGVDLGQPDTSPVHNIIPGWS